MSEENSQSSMEWSEFGSNFQRSDHGRRRFELRSFDPKHSVASLPVKNEYDSVPVSRKAYTAVPSDFSNGDVDTTEFFRLYFERHQAQRRENQELRNEMKEMRELIRTMAANQQTAIVNTKDPRRMPYEIKTESANNPFTDLKVPAHPPGFAPAPPTPQTQPAAVPLINRDFAAATPVKLSSSMAKAMIQLCIEKFDLEDYEQRNKFKLKLLACFKLPSIRQCTSHDEIIGNVGTMLVMGSLRGHQMFSTTGFQAADNILATIIQKSINETASSTLSADDIEMGGTAMLDKLMEALTTQDAVNERISVKNEMDNFALTTAGTAKDKRWLLKKAKEFNRMLPLHDPARRNAPRLCEYWLKALLKAYGKHIDIQNHHRLQDRPYTHSLESLVKFTNTLMYAMQSKGVTVKLPTLHDIATKDPGKAKDETPEAIHQLDFKKREREDVDTKGDTPPKKPRVPKKTLPCKSCGKVGCYRFKKDCPNRDEDKKRKEEWDAKKKAHNESFKAMSEQFWKKKSKGEVSVISSQHNEQLLSVTAVNEPAMRPSDAPSYLDSGASNLYTNTAMARPKDVRPGNVKATTVAGDANCVGRAKIGIYDSGLVSNTAEITLLPLVYTCRKLNKDLTFHTKTGRVILTSPTKKPPKGKHIASATERGLLQMRKHYVDKLMAPGAEAVLHTRDNYYSVLDDDDDEDDEEDYHSAQEDDEEDEGIPDESEADIESETVTRHPSNSNRVRNDPQPGGFTTQTIRGMNKAERFHNSTGHMGREGMLRYAREDIECPFTVQEVESMPLCNACAITKVKAHAHEGSIEKEAELGDLIVYDAMYIDKGQASGETTAHVFVDAKSDRSWVFLSSDNTKETFDKIWKDLVRTVNGQLKRASIMDMFICPGAQRINQSHLKDWGKLSTAENEEVSIRRVVGDPSGQMNSELFKESARAAGIDTRVCTAEEHEVITYAEKRIDVLRTIARTHRCASKISERFQGESIIHASQASNRIPRRNGIPLKHWQKAHAQLKPFGCSVFIKYTDAERREWKIGKNQAGGGYYGKYMRNASGAGGGYRIYHPARNRFVERSNLVFDERVHLTRAGDMEEMKKGTYEFPAGMEPIDIGALPKDPSGKRARDVTMGRVYGTRNPSAKQNSEKICPWCGKHGHVRRSHKDCDMNKRDASQAMSSKQADDHIVETNAEPQKESAHAKKSSLPQEENRQGGKNKPKPTTRKSVRFEPIIRTRAWKREQEIRRKLEAKTGFLGLFSSKTTLRAPAQIRSDEWYTPTSLFDRLNEKFHFNEQKLFPAGGVDYTDSLSKSCKWENNFFVNGPFSKLDKITRRAAKEAKRGKSGVVLLPLRTPQWFFNNVVGHARIAIPISGRIAFGDGRKATHTNARRAPFDCIIVVYGYHDVKLDGQYLNTIDGKTFTWEQKESINIIQEESNEPEILHWTADDRDDTIGAYADGGLVVAESDWLKGTDEALYNTEVESADAQASHWKDDPRMAKDRPSFEGNRALERALQSMDKEDWLIATNNEVGNFLRKGVFVWEKELPGMRMLDYKWVLKIKAKDDGRIDKYKVRLVAKGFRQIEGVDYREADTHAPVMTAISCRMLFAYAAGEGTRNLYGVDFEGAFLMAFLHEDTELYLRPPPQLARSGYVWRLKKAIPGLKQAATRWYETLKGALEEEGFKVCVDDPCLFTYDDGKHHIKLGIHVDDGLAVTESKEKWEAIIHNLVNKHKLSMSSSGQPKVFVGMNVTVGDDFIRLSHESKITDIVKEYLDLSIMYRSPGSPSAKQDDTPYKEGNYRTLLGKLMHLSVWTRPDIAADVSKAASLQDKPTVSAWKSLLRIVGYLNSTKEEGLVYQRTSAVEESNARIGKHGHIEGYVDADYAEDLDDRKSTSGYVFYMNGAPIAWRSKKQPCIALSTTESEYVAATMAAQEAAWIARVAKAAFDIDTGTMTIWEDNMGCIARSQKDPHLFRSRAKHIATRWHYIRAQVKEGKLILRYCPTNEMAADPLTKILTPQAHELKRPLLVKKHP